MLAELKNIHRLRERILESSRDNSGHINMVMLVDSLWAEANFSYYIIGIDPQENTRFKMGFFHKEIVEAVFQEVEQFAFAEQEDDMTLMLVKRK